MPTIISRVYADKKSAEAARAALAAAGFDADAISGAGASVPAKGIGSSGVAAATAALKSGKSVVIAAAGFGKARKAAAIADGFDPLSVPGLGRDLYVMDNPNLELSEQIQRNKRYATPLRDVQGHGRISSLFGLPLLTSKSTSRSAYSGTVRMGGPVALLTGKKTSLSAYSGTVRMGGPLPLLSKR
jgi:hypothetical protein